MRLKKWQVVELAESHRDKVEGGWSDANRYALRMRLSPSESVIFADTLKEADDDEPGKIIPDLDLSEVFGI